MRYKKPSLALKIGQGLNNCAFILLGEAIQTGTESERQNLTLFQTAEDFD